MTVRRCICLLILVLLAGSAACRREKKRIIGVIPKATAHLFFMSIKAGVDDAAKEAGVEYQWNGPGEETDHARQIQIVDAMVTQRVDAIAISATDQTALVAPVRRAIAAGIPVTVFDSGLDVDDYVTFVATDNYEAGQNAARLLAGLVGGKGKVAMLMHKPGGKSTGDREKGFDEIMAKEFPNVKVVARQFGMADRAKSRAAAENILTAHPDLAGMFASAEANSLGAIHAIRSRGMSGKLRLITFDFSDTHVEALKEGTIDIMLVQDPHRIGYEALKSLTDKLSGKTPAKRMDLKVRVIEKKDLDKPEVQALLFPEWRKKQ